MSNHPVSLLKPEPWMVNLLDYALLDEIKVLDFYYAGNTDYNWYPRYQEVRGQLVGQAQKRKLI